MKLLVVCQNYYPEPFRITDICEELVKRGHDITVLTGLPNYADGIIHNNYRHGKNRKEEINGVHVIRTYEIGRGKTFFKRFFNYFSYALSASREAKRLPGDFDAVFVYQLSPVMMAWPAMAYKKKYNKKMILYCLDLWPDSLAAGGIHKNKPVYNVFLKISRKIYKTADKIAVTSESFKTYFKDVIGINPENILYLPQYAEDYFTMDCAKKEGSDTGIYHFVFAGNIGDMQSVDTIIKAANELKSRRDIVFDIVGDGSRLDECKNLAKKLKTDNIIFHGRRPLEEMPDYYEMADAMIASMKNDEIISYTLPGKIQTYMAAGKPIIGAINGETRFIIEDAGCGYCCEAENYLQLTEAIKTFLREGKAVKMGQRSRQYYLDHFSKEKVMDELEGLFCEKKEYAMMR